MFWTALVGFINMLLSALGTVATLVFNLLPNGLYYTLEPTLNNWTSAIGEDLLVHLNIWVGLWGIYWVTIAWASFMVVFYAIRVVGKWVKML